MRKLAAVAVVAVIAAACGRESDGGPSSGDAAAGRPAVRALASAVSLERFDACPELLDHLRTAALERVGPYGLPGMFGAPGVLMAEDSAGGAERSAAVPQTAAPPAHSGTNVQEADVDEPDIVKTDGRHIFTLRTNQADGRQLLVSVAVVDGTLRKDDDLMLPQAGGYELLLAGDRMLAMGQRGGFGIAEDARAGAAIAPTHQEPGTVIAVIDVSDRESMRITHKLELDGTYASARMIDGVARIVLNAQASPIAFEQPTSFTVDAQRKTLDANKAKIRSSDLEDWLPHFQLQDDSGKLVDEGPLSSCDSTFHPKSFSGFGEMSVVTIDPSDPNPRESATVLGSAGTIYASTDNLYVATQSWPQAQPLVLSDRPVGVPEPVPASPKTSLHRFDISDPARAVYAASGEVRGTVLNQWSLSEHEGHLRVATTEDRFTRAGDNSASFVTVLGARGDKLTKVASVDEISPGERIYGVRFMGEVGYVVTFRQIDPLHVLDLSDPTRPRALGELKIPGYSAYLHPVGDGRLLGIGRDADLEGRPLGVSLSLFDVSDPSKPTRLDAERLVDTYTQVEHDHHAFTWWEPLRLAIVPVELQNVVGSVAPREPGAPDRPVEKAAPSSYLYGFRVDDDAITKLSRLTHQQHTAQHAGQIMRSIMIDDTLYSISAAGIAASDPSSFAEKSWLALS